MSGRNPFAGHMFLVDAQNDGVNWRETCFPLMTVRRQLCAKGAPPLSNEGAQPVCWVYSWWMSRMVV